MKDTSSSWTQKINTNGYRLTGARRMVIDIISNSPRALTPAEIFIEARSRGAKLGLVTVYRTLEKLEEMTLVERVHHEDGCHAYIAHVEGHQHLLLCRVCHRVEYFGGDDLVSLAETISRRSGYEVQEHWLQLVGICPDCRALVNKEALS
jgi:Fur family ferric uptake transcriptional regulator